MLKKTVSMIAGLLAVLVMLSGMLPPGPPVRAADPRPPSKISSLLDLRLKAKQAATTRSMTLQRAQLPGADRGTLRADESPSREKIYIYFAQKPTSRQVSELAAVGVTVYADSWIPPVGNHPHGFVLADAPIERIADLAARADIVRMDSAAQTFYPQNDLGREAMNVGGVWSGGWNGTGVTVAVLDSSLDLSHPDFPTPVAKKDYSNYPTLDDDVSGTVSGHGTHVTGSVLGRGNLNPRYTGSAPGAGLVFIKIGNDTDASASSPAMSNAIRDARVIYNAQIISMSYGGWSTYHDGSEADCQAVDYAVSRGATVFISAGNNGARGWHYSGTVPANGTTDFIAVNFNNISSATTIGWGYNLVWYDPSSECDLTLEYYDSNQQPVSAIWRTATKQSPRGTKSQISGWGITYDWYYYLPTGTYTRYLKVRNNSAKAQFFHIYDDVGNTRVTFANPDPNYTIGSPSEADSAITVGAYVTRGSWTNYLGTTYTATSNPNPGVIANFSSRGPRVDGGATGKPNIVAPGAQIISARDSIYTPGNTTYDPAIISNSDTRTPQQPANYYVMQGTSMATPLAAGVGALILQKNPAWTPARVRHALEKSAVDKGDSGWDGTYGWGLVNAGDAVNTAPSLGSYSDAARSTARDAFSGSSTVYLRGTGLLPGHSYQVAWYNGTGSKIITTTLTSTSGGVLDTDRAFVPASDPVGNWYVVVCEPQFTPPNTYDATWPYTIVSDTFAYGNAPAVTTGSASDVTSTGATLNGNLTSLGTATTVNVSFEYGTSTAYGTTTPPQAKTATGAFSQAVTGLTTGTTHHFRARAESIYGTATGADATFTPAQAPAVTTLPVTGTTTVSTTLNGYLTSLGTATQVNANFEYGTTDAYGSSTPNQSRTATGAFSASVTGLNTATTYHYRARADGGSHGLGLGAGATFTTFAANQTVAETGLSQTLDSDGVAVVNVNINRIKNITTGDTAQVPGGVSGYSATMSSTQYGAGHIGTVTGMEIIGIRGVTPYDSPAPTINATTGVFGTSGITSPQQPDNSTTARLVLKLTGDKDTAYNLNVAFQQITPAGGGNIPEQNSNGLVFRRGDATGNGVVDVFDAMYIAQYIVGIRPLSQINVLNAACVKHDGTGGDKIDVFDAMYIAQMLVGIRNNRFEVP